MTMASEVGFLLDADNTLLN
jgi:hypothetical protein